VSIIADIFVADPEAAGDYAASQLRGRPTHIKKYQPAEYRGLTPLEFGSLWALIAGEEWSAKKHMLTEVSYGESNESWLFSFPEPFVRLLAGLGDNEVDQHSVEWAKTEELQLSGSTPADVRPIIVDLRRMAKAALTSGKPMYLWGSL
jgi:hypothetical protein